MIRCADRYSFLEPRLNQRLSSRASLLFPARFHPFDDNRDERNPGAALYPGKDGRIPNRDTCEIVATGSPNPSAPSRSTTRPVSRHQSTLVENPVVRSARVTSLRFEQCSSTRSVDRQVSQDITAVNDEGLIPDLVFNIFDASPRLQQIGSCTSSRGVP